MKFLLHAGMFDALNHPNFANGGLNIVTNSPFGQTTGTTNQNGGYNYRVTQFSGRVEF